MAQILIARNQFNGMDNGLPKLQMALVEFMSALASMRMGQGWFGLGLIHFRKEKLKLCKE